MTIQSKASQYPRSRFKYLTNETAPPPGRDIRQKDDVVHVQPQSQTVDIEDGVETTEASLPILPTLFVFSFLLPFVFYIGPIRLTFYRLLLITSFAPLFFIWIAGKKGKPHATDWMILGGTLWACLSLMVSGGIDGYEATGIMLIETFGAYLLGRVCVENYGNFLKFTRLMFWFLLLLVPLAVLESFTGRNFVLETFRSIGSTYPVVRLNPRMGLERAQVVFEHPILFGGFAASFYGFVGYTLGYRKLGNRLSVNALTAVATICSMSTGPLLSFVMQSIFMFWDRVTKTIARRWKILGGLFASLYVLIDLLSTRNPFQVFVTYLTFSTNSSYNRILIWNYGTAEVVRHPLFGIGLGDWERPTFMSASMDNFWLATAVRYGLPTFILFAVGVLLLMRKMGRVVPLSNDVAAARAGLLITYMGVIIGGTTTHYWNAMYCWMFFLFGAGSWVLRTPVFQTPEEPMAPVKQDNTSHTSLRPNTYVRNAN